MISGYRSRHPYSKRIFFTAVAAILLVGCNNAQPKEASAPPVVEAAAVVERDVPVHSEWTASTDGFANATIRAQVQGYLIERCYGEGEFVKQGQILFKIDPRPLQATLEQAVAQLTQQQARWQMAKANLERIKPIVEQEAVSRKDLDDAIGNELAADAAVVAAKAQVDKAQVDLGFTQIASPIAGIAGIARAQLGNLVGPGSIEELTTVSTVDPIKVYVPMSEQEYLNNVQLSRSSPSRMPFSMILANGVAYPHVGTLAFADRQVDVRTGTIRVVVLFPNPGNVLRPGQFARVKAQTGTKKNARLVPQRAVTELQGGYQAAVVGADNRVEMRSVKVSKRIGDLWVVEEGLLPGERVIAEGLQKVRDGMLVSAKPFTKPNKGAIVEPGAGDPLKTKRRS
jgi:membrane fusion protein (multidrug efflux system)